LAREIDHNHIRTQRVGNRTKASYSHNGDWSCFLAYLLTCLHTLAHTRLSCCVAYLQQQVLMLVRSTSVWLPRSQVHTTAFSFSIAQRAALHPLALLYSSTSNDCCVTVLQVSVMACRVASLQAFGVRSPPSLYVPSISLILVPMFDSHWQCVLL